MWRPLYRSRVNPLRKLGLASFFFLELSWLSGAIPSQPSTKLTDKDTILLANLANTTCDQNFDGTLEEALRMALDESPFLRIFSGASVVATLKGMGRPANTPLTPEIARAVCERAKCKAYVTGSISGQGKELVVGLKVTDCLSG